MCEGVYFRVRVRVRVRASVRVQACGCARDRACVFTPVGACAEGVTHMLHGCPTHSTLRQSAGRAVSGYMTMMSYRDYIETM
jgi:hypothetical protein